MGKPSRVRQRKSKQPAEEVFLNLPYDSKFESLYLAYIVGTNAFGLAPRATLELPIGARLDRILALIQSCRYSIHDLSRVQLDRNTPATPRFNMPFELGLAVAYERSGHEHGWMVFEQVNRRIMKSLSDLNGNDVYIHTGTVAGVFSELCNAFVRSRHQPTVPQMWKVYRSLRRALPAILRESGARSLFEARAFRDLCASASTLADLYILGEP